MPLFRQPRPLDLQGFGRVAVDGLQQTQAALCHLAVTRLTRGLVAQQTIGGILHLGLAR